MQNMCTASEKVIHRGLELEGVNMLAKAFMCTVKSLHIGCMQLGQLLLELLNLQANIVLHRLYKNSEPLDAVACVVPYLCSQFLDLLLVL